MIKEQEINFDFLLFCNIWCFFFDKGLLNKNIHAKIVHVKFLTKEYLYEPHN